MYVAAAT